MYAGQLALHCPHVQQVALYRWNVYNVFLHVPSAVIRTLASRVLVLLEDGIGGDAPTNEGEPQEVSAAAALIACCTSSATCAQHVAHSHCAARPAGAVVPASHGWRSH